MPDPSPQRDILSVSQLATEVRSVLEGSFPLLWVQGEISNLARPASGHLYFSLKDARAQVRCALFRNKRTLLRFDPVSGDQVLARVRVGFYEPRGDFQLIVEHLEPYGAGAAQRAFEALKAKLQGEGLFDPARKRALPRFPRRLGVITSPSGAAIRDVLKVLAHRAPHLPVLLFPSPVQGDEAPSGLREALALAIERADCDVLLLTRGGGAAEDLAAFNDEALAYAIAACPIPIVSAVGHEIDFTISDFVADRRAPTPSAAAELIAPDALALRASLDRLAQAATRSLRRQLAEQRRQLDAARDRLSRAAPSIQLQRQQQRLDGLELRLSRLLRRTLDQRRGTLSAIGARLALQRPRRRLAEFARRRDTLSDRLLLAWKVGLAQRHQRLQGTMRQLDTVSPLATLRRGYAVLRRPDADAVVSRCAQVAAGDALRALVADGEIDVRVEATRPADAAAERAGKSSRG